MYKVFTWNSRNSHWLHRPSIFTVINKSACLWNHLSSLNGRDTFQSIKFFLLLTKPANLMLLKFLSHRVVHWGFVLRQTFTFRADSSGALTQTDSPRNRKGWLTLFSNRHKDQRKHVPSRFTLHLTEFYQVSLQEWKKVQVGIGNTAIWDIVGCVQTFVRNSVILWPPQSNHL